METIPLTQLELNTTGRIKEIRCNSSIKRRLLDLGFIRNTPITPIMKSIAGDPIAYEIRNIIVAIRAQDADKILVSRWNKLCVPLFQSAQFKHIKMAHAVACAILIIRKKHTIVQLIQKVVDIFLVALLMWRTELYALHSLIYFFHRSL